jgi:hypothetical protein
MYKATAVLLGVLLPLLGLAGVGQAQSSVQIQGTIEAVDCQSQTIVLTGPGTSNTVVTAPYTAVLVNSTSVPLCSLQQYVGQPATAWLLATGNEFVATRIDVAVATAVVPPPPVIPPAPAVVSPLPVAGIVLGTIAVAGLLYLLVRDHGYYYRYPYYGPYYRYYYRPWYRPYLGTYPPFVPVITVPQPLVGIVLGTIIVGGLAYLVTRGYDGQFYRYPYYGPYRQYYYRPGYRPYAGQGYDAPVRQGDPHWDAPAYRAAPAPPTLYRQDGPTHPNPGTRAPVQQSAQRPVPPAPRVTPAPYVRPGGAPVYRNPGNDPRPHRTPYPYQGAPVYQRYQHAPGYGGPGGSPYRYNTSRRAGPDGRQYDRRCSGGPGNQGCQSGDQGGAGR